MKEERPRTTVEAEQLGDMAVDDGAAEGGTLDDISSAEDRRK